MSSFAPIRFMSELDHVRIARLLPSRGAPDALTDLMDGAELLPPHRMPPRVVTMNSRLLLEDPVTGARQNVTLCYPIDADAGRNLWSVLSPAGSCLLGLTEGEQADWRAPDDRRHALRLLSVLYQPEASGDYRL